MRNVKRMAALLLAGLVITLNLTGFSSPPETRAHTIERTGQSVVQKPPAKTSAKATNKSKTIVLTIRAEEPQEEATDAEANSNKTKAQDKQNASRTQAEWKPSTERGSAKAQGRWSGKPPTALGAGGALRAFCEEEVWRHDSRENTAA